MGIPLVAERERAENEVADRLPKTMDADLGTGVDAGVDGDADTDVDDVNGDDNDG